MTYGFQIQEGGGENPMSLGDYIKNDARALQWATQWMYVRCPWIKVTFIPERYYPSGVESLDTKTTSFPAEKPSIAWINDDGETARFLTGVDGTQVNPTMAQAMSFGGGKFKTRLFDRKMTFKIKPYSHAQEMGYNVDNATPGNPGVSFNKYMSSNRWVPTQALGGRLARLFIPRGNLLWGFFDDAQYRTYEFKYKTIIEYKLVFKQPYANV